MTSNAQITPLERIRQAEKECAEHIRAAQAGAEEHKKDARRRASRIKHEASAAGRQQGEHDYRAALDAAEQDAKRIVAEACQRAEQLDRTSDDTIDRMVDQALTIVCDGDGA